MRPEAAVMIALFIAVIVVLILDAKAEREEGARRETPQYRSAIAYQKRRRRPRRKRPPVV